MQYERELSDYQVVFIILETLSYIGEKLNEINVTWGVGASILLSQYGLVDSPNDIDILVDIRDIDKVDSILQSLGEKKEWEKTSTYSTKYFYEYVIDSIDVDVMAGLAINHKGGIFEYVFDKKSVSDHIDIYGVSIPFTSMEDWYVIYQLIPNREAKVAMIEDYLQQNGIKAPYLLERSLCGNLPVDVSDKVNKMLKKGCE